MAGTLKRKWHLLPVSGKKEKRKLVVGQGSWRTELKPRTPGKRRARKIRKLVVGQGWWRTELKPRTPGKRRARKRRNILHNNPSR